MTAAISVVVTCYNLERYIREAINSVLQQEGVSEVEVIVVDDCSTDGSANIIQALPVQCIRTPTNSGVLLAMLQGIEAATGDIICFLDGDDVWEKEKLASVLEAFQRDDRCTLVTHDLTFIDGEGHTIARQSRPSRVLNPIESAHRSAKVREGILALGDYVWLGSALAVRRSLGKVDEFVRWARSLPDPANSYQDWPLAFWVASLPDLSMTYVPEKLFRYRLHQANYSGDARTAARAVRNLTRTKNTLEAMSQIAADRGLSEYYCRRIDARAASNEYLIDLYRGKRLSAFPGFVRSIPTFFRQGILLKEAVRLASIQLVGPDIFARRAR